MNFGHFCNIIKTSHFSSFQMESFHGLCCTNTLSYILLSAQTTINLTTKVTWTPMCNLYRGKVKGILFLGEFLHYGEMCFCENSRKFHYRFYFKCCKKIINFFETISLKKKTY
jgi:hypothetical protein